MAFIYMDYVGPLIENMKMNYALWSKFNHAWPMKDDDIFEPKLTFYRQSTGVITDNHFKRFLKAIGGEFEEFERQQYDEIESVWFYLNPYKEQEEDAAKNMKSSNMSIHDIFNDNLEVGDIAYVKVIYAGQSEKVIDGHENKWRIDGDRTIVGDGINTSVMFEKIFRSPFRYIANIVESRYSRDSQNFTMVETKDIPDVADAYNPKTYEVPKGIRSKWFESSVHTTVLASRSPNLADDSNAEYFSFAPLDNTESVFEVTKNPDGTKKIIESGYTSYTGADDGYVPKFQAEDVDPLLYPEYAAKYPEFLSRGSLIMEDDWKDIHDFNKAGTSSGYYEIHEYKYNGGNTGATLYAEIERYIPKVVVKDNTYNFMQDTIQKKLMHDMYFKNGGTTLVRGTPTGQFTFDWRQFYGPGGLSKKKIEARPRYEFVEFLAKSLDTDFKAEDPSFFEKLIAIIIVVIAIVVLIYTVGTAAPAVSAMTALATGLGYASLVLTIGVMILSQMGASAMGLVKIIGKVAQIVGYAAMITGIIAAVQNAYLKMAQEAVKTGAVSSTSDYTVGMFAQDVISNVTTKLTDGLMSAINTVLDLVTNPVNGLMGSPMAGQSTSLMGFLTKLQSAFNTYQKFFSSNGDTAEKSPSEEQADKRSYQFPEQLYQMQEMAVYEQDALEKMSMMKDQQFGGHKTEQVMSAIA